MSVSGWIGVDLDGTLAKYTAWNGGAIGEPVPLMLARVKRWVAQGVEVRIMTARVANSGMTNSIGQTDGPDFVAQQTNLIQDWLEAHGLPRLKVTASKDFAMIELWDDRAVCVECNTGRFLCYGDREDG